MLSIYYHKKNDFDAPSRRIPICLLIQTSGCMKPYERQLKKATEKLIEALSSHADTYEKTDFEIITFDSFQHITIKIEMQELYNIVDKGKLKDEYESCIDFRCGGYAPIGYALKVALDELRNRYKLLRENGMAPCTPILLVISGGLPSVAEPLQVEHDRILAEELAHIRCLVSDKRLIVYVIEFDWQQNECFKTGEYKLMQDITGLDNDERIIRYAEDDLKGLFQRWIL